VPGRQSCRPGDNVLAVAGAAHGYPGMLIFGLALSIALMAVAANLVANLLERHRWLAYLASPWSPMSRST
jgi:predicted tellurium resistance membrane protein TerC